MIPNYATIINFSNCFNEGIENIYFPSSLTELIFGYWFNQSIKNVSFPESLIKLCFDDNFEQDVNNIKFPPQLKYLKLGAIDSNIDQILLPASLKVLNFGSCFNQNIDHVKFPTSLHSIIFGDFFNKKINNVSLQKINSIYFGLYDNNLNNLEIIVDKLYIKHLISPITNLSFNVKKIINAYCSIEDLQIDFKKNISKSKIPFGCRIETDYGWLSKKKNMCFFLN